MTKEKNVFFFLILMWALLMKTKNYVMGTSINDVMQKWEFPPLLPHMELVKMVNYIRYLNIRITIIVRKTNGNLKIIIILHIYILGKSDFSKS